MARTKGSSGGETARRIIDESRKLFASYGYEAVTTRMIAEAVGVQVGALYNHFPNKQTILLHVMREHMQLVIERYDAVSHPSDPRAALEDFARFHYRHHKTRKDEVFLAYMELRSLTEENFKVIEDLRKQYEHALRKIIDNGMKSGAFLATDAHVTTMGILAMLTGAQVWIDPNGRLSHDEIEDAYAQMCLRAAGCRIEEAALV